MTENGIKFDRFAASFPCDSNRCTAPFRTISKTCNAVVLRTHHREKDYISYASYENYNHQMLASYSFLCIHIVFHTFTLFGPTSTDYVNYSSIFCIWQTKAFYQSSLKTSKKTLYQSMHWTFKITIIDMSMVLYVSNSSSFF